MIKFAMIECDTPEEFEKCMFQVEKRFGKQTTKYIPTENGDVTSKAFVELMLLKGYKVNSQRSRTFRCQMFNIRREKLGNEWWYKLDDIEKVPKKH
jgi:hypothetical protein